MCQQPTRKVGSIGQTVLFTWREGILLLIFGFSADDSVDRFDQDMQLLGDGLGFQQFPEVRIVPFSHLLN
jgi:hypothetical protein